MNKDGIAFTMCRVCFIIKPWWDAFGCLCSDAIETTCGEGGVTGNVQAVTLLCICLKHRRELQFPVQK